MKHKLELYGTLGPADNSKESLKKMFQAGMTGIRLNLSHMNLVDCEPWLLNLYEVSEHLHIVPDILVDLQGPELRIGALHQPLTLEKDMVISFEAISKGKQAKTGENGEKMIHSSPSPVIPIPDSLFPHMEKEQIIRLDDGRILLEIIDESPYMARVISGGVLFSRKSLSIDGLSLDLPTLTTQDLENLKLLRRYHITGVMLPFARNKEDLIFLKQTLLRLHLANIRVFAKIENMAGVNQLPALLPYCDHIVIARGDLGNAMPLSKLPAIQKKIALTCLRTKTPFMVVTQMLSSMESRPTPTRAEVSDIFNAVLDGASSLMLTGETAVGSYPVEAMQILSDTSFEALQFQMESKFL